MIEKIHLMILSRIHSTGTLTAAAGELNLTQSALTHAIRKLEGQIGTQIWAKDGRKLKLTQSGQLLLELADTILPQIEHAESLLKQFAAGKRGILRIGMECHPCYNWLQNILPSFLQAWPDVEVELKQQFNGIKALVRREIDVLITPDPYFSKHLEYFPVLNYEQVLAVSNSQNLAGRNVVSPQDLTEETLITYPVSMDRLDIFTGFLKPASCRPAAVKKIETTDIMLQMVAAGRGITALPDFLIDEYKKKLPLSSLKLGKKGIEKSIYIGRRISEKHPTYVNSFIEMAEKGSTEAKNI